MNPIRPQNFISIDLELNNKQDGTTPKIIQVGVSIGSPVRPDDIKTFSWYLDPEEEITPFITKLTGIDNQLIKEKAVPHQIVAEELGALININKCFVNPIVWGGGGEGNDATELKDEFRERNIDFPFFGRRVVDVKTLYVFNQMVQGKSPSGGLRKSMLSYGIDFQGQSHRAEIDALNTLRFFFYFLEKQRKFEEYKELMRTLK
jgi:inhibitor of KinA sporulation pathway (predicted exonuclease)